MITRRMAGNISKFGSLTSPEALLTLGASARYLAQNRGYGEKVSHELPKLLLRVRFPLPAPTI